MATNKHGKSAKEGRNKRWAGNSHSETKYVSRGGPGRAAARAARNHGCEKPIFHVRGKRDAAHAREWRPANG